MRRILPVLVILVVFAGVLSTKASFGSPSPTPRRPAAIPAAVDLETLLSDGDGDITPGYFKPTSGSLVAAAAGKYNSRFYNLGELLVRDGFSNTILDLGREMNGTWYEWSEHRAPSSEPDAYILAWQQIQADHHPEWGLDFHTSGGQDDPLFITNMMAWMKAHHAIGLYWAGQHVSPAPTASGPLLANQGASAQNNTPGAVNGLGNLTGGRLQYAGLYLPDGQRVLDSVVEPLLVPWVHAGYQLILSVPIVPNPWWIRSYSGPPEPGNKPYQLADHPDAVAALRHGVAQDRLRLPALVPAPA